MDASPGKKAKENRVKKQDTWSVSRGSKAEGFGEKVTSEMIDLILLKN